MFIEWKPTNGEVLKWIVTDNLPFSFTLEQVWLNFKIEWFSLFLHFWFYCVENLQPWHQIHTWNYLNITCSCCTKMTQMNSTELNDVKLNETFKTMRQPPHFSESKRVPSAIRNIYKKILQSPVIWINLNRYVYTRHDFHALVTTYEPTTHQVNFKGGRILVRIHSLLIL